MEESGGRKIVKKVVSFSIFVFCFLLFIAASIFIDTVNREKKDKIPELIIGLNNVTLDGINNGPKNIAYDGNEAELISNGEKTEIKNVEIRGRGNASWDMEKKSYRLKFSSRVDFLGLGKQKKLALISNNIDDSLMRNDLGQFIAGIIYKDYPVRGDFVHLRIDNADLGLYYAAILVDADKYSLGLNNETGIIVEIDNAYCSKDLVFSKTNEFGDCLQLSGIVSKDSGEVSFSRFARDYNEFEKALKKKDFKKISEIIDVESWAKYFVMSEFTSNPDAYITSWYLYKDSEESKIKANIGWDFDAAFGNRNWGYGDEIFYSPNGTLTRLGYTIDEVKESDPIEKKCNLVENSEVHLISPSMCYMLMMPEFQKLVAKTYRTFLMGHRAEIIEYIKETAAYIREDAINDSNIWHKGSFDDEIEYLLWWVDKRFDYFDEKYGGTSVVLYNNRYE